MTTATATKSKRRFLRFSLRALLLFMLIVCVTLGWKVEKARKQREAVAWALNSGGTVSYDYMVDTRGRWLPNSESTAPAWLRKFLGVDFFHDVVEVRLRTESWLELVRPIPISLLRAKRMEISAKSKEIKDVTPLAELTTLRHLDLGGTQVADVTPLAGLTSLKQLSLHNTHVADVTPLAGLTILRALDLRGAQVSDVRPWRD